MRTCDSLPNVAIRLFDTDNSIRFIRMTYGHSYYKIDLSSLEKVFIPDFDRPQIDFSLPLILQFIKPIKPFGNTSALTKMKLT